MQRKPISILAMLLFFYLIIISRGWAWTPGIHEGLATTTSDKCVELPKPRGKRCNAFVDEGQFLKQSLRYGSILPDIGNPSDPSHDYNPNFDSTMAQSVSTFYSVPQGSINAGLALQAISNEVSTIQGFLAGINCNSSLEYYRTIWKHFGILSHYPADISVPLHTYCVNINNTRHEGDVDSNGYWYEGLWEHGLKGRFAHRRIESKMAEGINFGALSCNSMPPGEVAANARSDMRSYISNKTLRDYGYLGLMVDYVFGMIDYQFFNGIGQPRANDAVAGILNSWQEALKDFMPPSNCKEEPAGGCGDCGGGTCPPPGGDYPDDTASVSTLSSPPTSEDLLEQAWDRLAAKKNKKSLIWYWMQEYLMEEFYQGNIDEETYQMLAQSYGLTADTASELFYDDYITSPDVAILGKGFALAMSDLLQNKFYEPIRRFTVDDFSPDALKDYPIFIIPSGGLMGLEKSDIFKVKLDEYVKNGGTLIVFSQQHGYEFSALPIPQEADGTYKEVFGYGWTEDQSCFYSAAYIDTWHQILAGQNRSTPNFHMDGYFTSYPSNSTILLRRTANGQPALLMYEYGQGKVIVTSMYSDFALEQNQASSDEISLIRDIINWAKEPDDLQEIRPGQTVTVSLSAKNNTTNDASSVKLSIYSPDRSVLLSEQTMNTPVPAGSSTQLTTQYSTLATASLGIYHIDYTLYDSSGTITQPQAETDSGRFVVSNPPQKPSQTNQMTFSIQSDSQSYLWGTTVTFTITAFNNSAVERTITAKFGGPDYKETSRIMVVPAKGSTIFLYSKAAECDHDHYSQEWGMLWVSFYEGTKQLDSFIRWYPVYPLSANVSVQTDKTIYAKGEPVTITASLKNNIPFAWQPIVQIVVYDPKGIRVFEDSKILTVSPYGTGSVSNSFSVSTDSPIGYYGVSVNVPFRDWYAGYAWRSFEVLQSQISVSPNLPSAFTTGTNTIPFIITNTGKINVSSGTIDLSLKAPDGSIVYSRCQPFSIAVGESKRLDIPISLSNLQLENYVLTYSQSDETRAGKPASVTLSNSYNLNLSLDKPSYKIGEGANVTASITNTGKFLQEASLTLDAPFLAISETKPVTINPSETANIPYSLSLPLTLNQGGPTQVTLTFPSGDQISKGIYLAIKPVKIEQKIIFDKPSYRIRENLGINYTVTNDGNFASPLNVSFTISIPGLNYTHEGSLILEPLKAVEMPLVIPIPETILAGWHNVDAALVLPWGTVTQVAGFVVPESSLTLNYLGTTTPRPGDTMSLTIENTGGVDTTYTTEKLSIIDKQAVEIYHGSVTGTILTGEKRPLVDMQIPPQATNGAGYLQVRIRDSKTGKTAYFDKAIEIAGIIASLQTRTDKSAYLNTEAITGISNLSNGQFGIEGGSLKVSVSKITRSATGQFTQFLPKIEGISFSYPGGVAVAPNSSIYVADTDNHRIQKFDNDGNFIMKWGSEGSGDGQFKYPYGIAIGPDGSVYVADYENNRIQKFDSNGNFITKWGSYCTTDTLSLIHI